MFRMLFVFICTVGSFSAHCGEPLSKQTPSIVSHQAPQTFVNDTVNVIDGNFCMQMQHLTVPGHVPLDLVQYYNNQSSYEGWRGTGMSLNYGFWIQGREYSEKKHDTEEKYALMIAEAPGGSIITCLGVAKSTGKSEYYLDPDVIYKGLSNCGSGKISARSNLKNVRIRENVKNDGYGYWTCYLPDGAVREYEKSEHKEWAVNILTESRLNRTRLKFKYDNHDDKKTIEKIEGKAFHTMNWLRFSSNRKEHKDTIESSNGKSAHFHYFNHHDDKYIHKVESSDNPTQEFFYTKAGKYYCINKVQWPDGRFLEVEYDKKARVTAQKAPVGENGKLETIYSFNYQKDCTEVTDGRGQKLLYRHKNNNISSIESSGYRTQAYYWGKRKGLSWAKRPKTDEGNLMGYATLDALGNGVSSCYYMYDKYGNILKEALSGNLSGNSPLLFKVDDEGKPEDSTIEKYQKSFGYDRNHLLTYQAEDAGPTYEYRYIKGTDLMCAKFTKDGNKIILREFYEYDEDHILKEKIIDDGSSDNKSCFTGMTQRFITHIWPVKDKTGFGQGLPEDVWENYYDLQKGTIVLLRHTHYTYNRAGQVVEEKIYDANNQPCYSIKYEFDGKGQLHKKTNPLGQTVTYLYDANNNKVSEELTGAGVRVTYEYDKANRCIKSIEHHDDETEVVTESEYDFMGNKTAFKDRYGQVMRYEYDHCNRLIKTTFPDGSTVCKEYDIFDNVVKETNQNGVATCYKYTIRNMPSHIIYADGSEERFHYNLNGTLAYKVDQCGTKTAYEYDVLDRVTKTTLFDSNSKQLSCATNSYNAFHLIETCDAMGLKTYFSYDYAGRKIAEWQEDAGNYSKTTYEYDTLGRLVATKRFYGDQHFVATVVEYDFLNRVTEDRQEDDTGRFLSSNSYEYDLYGNCIRKRTGHLVEGDYAEVRSQFNSKNELVNVTDELQNSTEFTHNHSFENAARQKTLQRITKDALKNSTVEYYDILGRVVSVLKTNAQGTILAATGIEYTPTGKKSKQVEHVFVEGQKDHEYVLRWEYDALDRLERLIEQPGSEEKVTSYTYDALGRVLTITKPDLVVLTHSYDALGRLVELRSSDNSIAYSYSYDLHNNPVEVRDEVSQLVTKRAYDIWGRLIEDGLQGEFCTRYEYDALGRLHTIKAPDDTLVQYNYDAYLTSIGRYSASGLLEYTHRYTKFDPCGRVVESELIHNLGLQSFVWDKKGRNISVTNDYFNQTIPSDGFDAVGNLKSYSFTDVNGKVAVECSYDDLYQLTEEKGIQNHLYSNDSLHNRVSKNGFDYTVDEHNKIMSDGKNSFAYDKNGNLLQDGVNKYSYDALNRLVAVETAHGTTRYAYDSFNRRIKKNDDYALYLDLREVGTYSNGKVTEYRVLGLGKGAELGASIAIELNGKVYCPIHDFRGNIVSLVDSSNQVTESYRYTAFGECEVHSHCAMPTNPWRFASKRFDSETGFSYFLNRYYSPSIGRWITPDPLGFADGPNMYAYVHNNPMTMFDLYGLSTSVSLDKYLFGVFGMFAIEDDNNEPLELPDPYQEFSSARNSLQETWEKGFTREHLELLGKEIESYSHSPGFPGGRTIISVVGNRFSKGINAFFNKLFNRTSQSNCVTSEITEISKQCQKLQNTARVGGAIFKNATQHNHPFQKDWIKVNKSIANQAQMSEALTGGGRTIAGPGSKNLFRDAPHKALEYGGTPGDWAKKSSFPYKAPDGKTIELHWIENIQTKEQREFKTIFDKKAKGQLESNR